MKPLRVWRLFVLQLLISGCAYHGAVYSEYSQVALDVRATAESSSPINVSFGYDRGVQAYVPKLKGKNGEACSIISWENIGSTLAPSEIGTNSVLRVDAGFISGTVAKVAAVPSGTTVIVEPEPESTAEQRALTTTGGPGERIATALKFAPPTISAVPTGLQTRRVTLAQKLRALEGDGSKANRVLAAAGFPTTAPDQAVTALQSRILEAQTEEAVKKLEDAFETVQ